MSKTPDSPEFDRAALEVRGTLADTGLNAATGGIWFLAATTGSEAQHYSVRLTNANIASIEF
jgi:hypothetical protein